MESVRHILQWCIYVVVTYLSLTISGVIAGNTRIDELGTPDNTQDSASVYTPDTYDSASVSVYSPQQYHIYYQPQTEPTGSQYFGQSMPQMQMQRQMPRQMARQMPRKMSRQMPQRRSLCQAKNCPIGSICRILQTCTRCHPHAVCLTQSRSVSRVSDGDDECERAGFSQCVMFGSSFNPRPMRCVPWLRSMARGGCAMGAICVTGGSTIGTLSTGTCCTGRYSAYNNVRPGVAQPSPSSLSTRQSVSTRSNNPSSQTAPIVSLAAAIPRQRLSVPTRSYNPSSRIAPIAPMSMKRVSVPTRSQNLSPQIAPIVPIVAPMPRQGIPAQPAPSAAMPPTYNPQGTAPNSGPFRNMVKFGSCPTASQSLPSSCMYDPPCLDDTECPNDLKCCPGACTGRSCSIPIL